MKTLAIMTAGLALLFSAATARADIRVGIMNEPYPPLFTKDASGQWVGFEVELLEAVCAELKEKCSIIDTSWDGLIPALQSKKVDLIWSAMSITDERRKTIDFTDKYYSTPSILVGLKDGSKGTAPEDVAEKTIGIQVSTIQVDYFNKYYADKATSKIYSTLDESFQDLAAGRIDYVFTDTLGALAFLDSEAGKQCCEDKGNVKDDPAILGAGIGGGLRKEDAGLRQKLNSAIAAVRASGKYNEIAKKFFSFDPYAN